MESDRAAQAAFLCACKVGPAARVCRTLGDLDWTQWRGNGDGRHRERANHSLNGIHERMPVIVRPEAFNLWLDCANVDAKTAAGLIAPASEDLLEAHEVPTAVNRTANDDPGLVERYTAPAGIEPVPPVSRPRVPAKRAKKDDGQGALF